MESLESILCCVGTSILWNNDTCYYLLPVSWRLFTLCYPQVIASLTLKAIYLIPIGGIKKSLDLLCDFYPSHLNHLLTVSNAAVWSGSAKMLQKAIAVGGEVNKQVDRFLLHVASAAGDIELVSTLLAKGFNVAVQDVNGNQPLHLAAMYKRTEVVSALLQAGAHVTNVNQSLARSPLHYALTPSQHAMKLTPKLQFYRVADPYSNSISFISSLQHFFPPIIRSQMELQRVFEIVNILIQNGASPLNQEQSLGNVTALHLAALYGPSSVVQLLLSSFINLFAASYLFDHGIELATNVGHGDIVAMLIVSPYYHLNDAKIHRAIKIAMQLKHKQIFQYLVNMPPDYYPVLALAPLEAALSEFEVLDFLQILARRVTISKIHFERYTHLHLAVMKGFKRVVRYLCANGADVCQKDIHNRTSIDIAIGPWRIVDVEMVELLLEQDVSSIINERDEENGNTLLHGILERKQTVYLEMFIAKGASVTMKNKKDLAPYQLGFNDESNKILRKALFQQEQKRRANMNTIPEQCEDQSDEQSEVQSEEQSEEQVGKRPKIE